MSKLKDFIEKIPELCGAEQAQIRGLRNRLLFEYEITNKKGILAREHFASNPNSRLDVLFDFEGDKNKKNYCRALLNIKMYTGYGEEDKVLENTLIVEEQNEVYPEIDSTYSISEATSVGVQAGWY